MMICQIGQRRIILSCKDFISKMINKLEFIS